MKVVGLTLPNGEVQDFSRIEDFIAECNKQRDQHSWVVNHSPLSQDAKNIEHMQYNYKMKSLIWKQTKKFNSPDPQEFDRQEQESMRRSQELAQEIQACSEAIDVYVNRLLAKYDSSDDKIRSIGRSQWAKVLELVRPGDLKYQDLYLEDWDSRLFHGSLEIENALTLLWKKSALSENPWIIK